MRQRPSADYRREIGLAPDGDAAGEAPAQAASSPSSFRVTATVCTSLELRRGGRSTEAGRCPDGSPFPGDAGEPERLFS
ncbi:MAG: hypothetical protein ACLVJH_15150 [Faecalibacterium prausnitzii]